MPQQCGLLLFAVSVTLRPGAHTHSINLPGAPRRVVLCFPYDAGVDFVLNFLAVVSLGAVPVPATPVLPDKFKAGMARLCHIIQDSGARCVLTTLKYKTFIGVQRRTSRKSADAKNNVWREVEWYSPSTKLKPTAAAPPSHVCAPGDVAFLQYTSGSTGDGKGVIVTHANLIAQLRILTNNYYFHFDGTDVIAGWLPVRPMQAAHVRSRLRLEPRPSDLRLAP